MKKTVRDALAAIARKNKDRLEAAKVVEAAKSPSSPLHSRFEWDNTKAGHEYRLAQARKLIRVFEIVTRKTKLTPVTIEVTTERRPLPEWTPMISHGYERTADVLAGSKRKEVLAAEHDRCLGHVKRLCTYLRHAGLVAQADAGMKWINDVGRAIGGITSSEAGN